MKFENQKILGLVLVCLLQSVIKEQLPCEQFLQQIIISRTFLCAKQVGEKRGRFHFVVEITRKALVLILIPL